MAQPHGKPIPRPRKPKFEPDTNGASLYAEDASLDDLQAWSSGAEALARMPPRRMLALTDSIGELRLKARREIESGAERIDRLRWEPEAMLDSHIGEILGARIMAGIPIDPPPDLLIGRLDPSGHTILYGTGGVGKGTLAASWITGLLNDEKRVLVVDYENHPDEWARRMAGMGAGALMSRVLHVAPLTAAWTRNRGALWTQADDLRQLAVQFEADYMVVDSLVTACAGNDPTKPEAVSQYTGALEYIGLPTLSLGHTDKAENLRYPFGSVFWHNLSRTTWSMKGEGAFAVLTHRKHNNYSRVPTMKVEVAWNEGGQPVNVDESMYAEDLARRISRALIGRSLTVREVCEALDDELDEDADPMKDNSVRVALLRGAKNNPPRFVQDDKRWSNVS